MWNRWVWLVIQKTSKTQYKDFSVALIQAIGVHIAFLALFVASSWNWQSFEPPMPPVRVSLVDMGPTVAEREAQERQRALEAERAEQAREEAEALERARQEAAARVERERQAELQAQREAEAKRAAEEAAREQAAREEAAEQARLARERREAARREEEARRQAEAEARERELAEIRAQREAAQREREEQERQLAELAAERLAKEEERRELEAAERLRLANEQAQADARRATLREEYILTIQELIRRNWNRPPTTAVGMNCTVKVFQIPGGEIISAELISPCNADQATRRSIETAINRVTALPYRGYESVFEREIEFGFRYDGQ